MYVGSYEVSLVVLSLLVAILASYTALDITGRISIAGGRSAYGWLAVGAFAMGTGIWSMHFIGMLAFSLPIPLGYDPAITILSLLIAIMLSAFALWLAAQPELPWIRLSYGALLMGAGIATMHYTGMAAMRMTPAIRYAPLLFLFSIVIAILASGAALWIAFRLRRHSARVRLLRAGASVLMGFAIVGMHYTGMAAAQFPVGSACGAVSHSADTGWLSIAIGFGAVSVIATVLTFSFLDRRMRARTAALSASLARAEELHYLATHDGLTKLPNREMLEHRLAQAISNACHDNRLVAVIFADLDGFKAINDGLGHHVGDLVLIEVAQRMLACVRVEDTVARIGGDEFVLLVHVEAPADAAAMAETILKSLGKTYDLANHELSASASLGIAFYPGSGEHPHDLLTSADAAMYRAKALGKNCYCFYDATMKANAREQLQLIHDLRIALEHEELMLHYQPKFDATGTRVTGVEALLRWTHPVFGSIPPGQFIPLAEKAGLMVPIGEWVLNEACRQLAQWRVAGRTDWTMAINLSAVQFRHSKLLESVRDALKRNGLEARYVILEITESTAMADIEASVEVLERLREMGVQIAIDDFGTGYSSLLQLKRLPAQELKIDRGFVRDLAYNVEDAAIVAAIVALGQTLNLRIVAEGVETAEQQACLASAGCESLQGFLLGRPMPPDQLLEATEKYEVHREEATPA